MDVGADSARCAVLRAPNRQQGFCGTCRSRVVAGAVDHRDTLLTDPERTGGMMLVCISRSQRRASHPGSVARLYYSAMPLAAWSDLRGLHHRAASWLRRHGRGVPGRPPRLPRGDALKVLPADVSADMSTGSGSTARPTSSRRCGIRTSSVSTTAATWRPDLDLDGLRGRTDAAELLRDRYPNGMPKEDVLDDRHLRRRGPRLRASARICCIVTSSPPTSC